MITYSSSERIQPREYVDFLRRSDLGSEYPRKNFGARITTLLERADICVTGRSESGTLVGVCLGLTDFAYFLFLTDLGVDRSLARQGIGATLVRMAHEAAGGEADICVITWANREAAPFYEACGMPRLEWAVGKHATEWEFFTVNEDTEAPN